MKVSRRYKPCDSEFLYLTIHLKLAGAVSQGSFVSLTKRFATTQILQRCAVLFLILGMVGAAVSHAMRVFRNCLRCPSLQADRILLFGFLEEFMRA